PERQPHTIGIRWHLLDRKSGALQRSFKGYDRGSGHRRRFLSQILFQRSLQISGSAIQHLLRQREFRWRQTCGESAPLGRWRRRIRLRREQYRVEGILGGIPALRSSENGFPAPLHRKEGLLPRDQFR